MLFETKRLSIVEAEIKDIPLILEIENDKENRDFIWVGTGEEHRNEIENDINLLLLFYAKDDGAIKGYTLVERDFKSHLFEIRRLAITDKGKGYGREAIKGLIRYAFEQTDSNRVFWDVYPDNTVGIALYESLGMHRDGVLRQNYLSDRGYLDQIIYSMLKSEYEERKEDFGE